MTEALSRPASLNGKWTCMLGWVAEIERNHEERKAQALARRMPNPLRARITDRTLEQMLADEDSGCLVCHK